MADQHIKDMPGKDHRAGPNEGWRAPRVEETGVAQSSIYDGAGNEIVVVTTTDADGRNKQGTGASAEEAMESAKDTKEPIGEGFGTAGGH
jgi:hypothetical protein